MYIGAFFKSASAFNTVGANFFVVYSLNMIVNCFELSFDLREIQRNKKKIPYILHTINGYFFSSFQIQCKIGSLRILYICIIKY